MENLNPSITISDTFVETIELAAGDAAFVSAECLHGGIPWECTYECAVFDLRLLMKSSDRCKRQLSGILHQQIILQSCFRAGNPLIDSTISPMFDALRMRCEGWELITLGCLFRFFGCAVGMPVHLNAISTETSGKRVLQLKKVFELIENDYASPLTLTELANAVHMSPKYFCRFFKAATHRTLIDYLNYYRIEIACSELTTTDKNVTEIAMDTGFSNPNYFIRQFRKYKGTTPGRYQNSMRCMEV